MDTQAAAWIALVGGPAVLIVIIATRYGNHVMRIWIGMGWLVLGAALVLPGIAMNMSRYDGNPGFLLGVMLAEAIGSAMFGAILAVILFWLGRCARGLYRLARPVRC